MATDKDYKQQRDVWTKHLDKELEDCDGKLKEFPQIIAVFLQPFEEALYPHIKRILINKYGIVSQVVRAKTF